eukprot:42128-Chlamydomonas_euryale.AAC.1
MRGCLLQMLGKSRFWTLWERIERSVAMTFVAALPRLHEVFHPMNYLQVFHPMNYLKVFHPMNYLKVFHPMNHLQ